MSSNNTSTINLKDGRQVFKSYGVTVAAFVPGRGYLKTSSRYSVTTSKHANGFAGKDATEVADSELEALTEPVCFRQ